MVHLFAGEDVVGGHLEACGEQAHCVAVLTLSLNKCAICKRVTHCLCTYVSLWMTDDMKMGQDSASLLSVSHHCTSNCMLVVHWHSSQVSGSAWVLILILTTPGEDCRGTVSPQPLIIHHYSSSICLFCCL